MNGTRATLAMLVVIIGAVGVASAGERATLELTGTVPVTSGDRVQMLLRLGAVDIPANAELESAYLHIPAPSAYPSEIVTLQVNAITGSWSGGPVDWSYLERTEGGNVQLDLYGRARVGADRRPEEIVLDVSTIVRAMHEGLDVSGLCLSVAPFEGDGIRTTDAAVMDRLGQARIEVRYRELYDGPPPPSAMR